MRIKTTVGLVEIRPNPIVIRIAFTPYLCCDECNDVYQNEMDCPVCQTVTNSDWWDDLFNFELNMVLHCEKCKTGFLLVGKEGGSSSEYLNYLWRVPA